MLSKIQRLTLKRLVPFAFALCLTLGTLTLGTLPALAAEAPVVNLNTADTTELSLLPRVGPALSQRIVDFRQENGKFRDTAEVMLVQGIGERTFELMEPYLTLEGETTLDSKVSTRDAQARLDATSKTDDPSSDA